ncbi:MAG: hypothetical protein JWN04_6542 [Myxococcaceae bacterium]|nr:hypothetical protein [Myxococcaceae bacterium]
MIRLLYMSTDRKKRWWIAPRLAAQASVEKCRGRDSNPHASYGQRF